MMLDIHGLRIACEASSPALVLELARPFKYFRTSHGTPSVTVVVEETPPPYSTFPAVAASFSTPRNVVYQHGRIKIVDYFGRGAVVHDPDSQRFVIYSADRNLLLEAFYLLVLSLLGQFCDRTSKLRVHALALSYRDRAFLFMMPQGAGKSTLGLAMMQQTGAKYISDDDPLFDRTGHILPFPRPLSVLGRESLAGIPDEFIYAIDRMEFGRKYFLDSDYWADRVESRPLDQIVLVTTRRVLNGPAGIAPTSRSRVFGSLQRDAVVGIGLYQGLEFLMNRSVWEAVARSPVLGRRLLLAQRLARAARPYQLTMSRDMAETSRVVRHFLETES